MSTITVSGEMSRELSQAKDCVEIRDSAGLVLGYFYPGLTEAEVQLYQELCQTGYSRTVAEFQQSLRQAQATGDDPKLTRRGKSIEEIMAKLKALP